MDWIGAETEPPGHGYYLAAWNDEGHWRVSELWFNPDSQGSKWWPTRGYMARFVGDVANNMPKRSLTVIAWQKMPEYPGPGPVIAYKWERVYSPPQGGLILDPAEVTIIREARTVQESPE